MTIYDIKYATQETAPFYFTRKTMRFFNQKMKDFKVYKQKDGRYLITAPMKNNQGKIVGYSERYFNPLNNKLELE